MSKISDLVYNALKEMFPNNRIIKEYYIKYKNTKLFFDFFIKDLGILVEVQGQQHVKFVAHFHGDKKKFYAQKRRDNLKIEYIEDKPRLRLIRFYYNEKITKDLIMEKIDKALENDSGFYE